MTGHEGNKGTGDIKSDFPSWLQVIAKDVLQALKDTDPKKAVAILTAGVLAASLSGCNGGKPEVSDLPDPTPIGEVTNTDEPDVGNIGTQPTGEIPPFVGQRFEVGTTGVWDDYGAAKAINAYYYERYGAGNWNYASVTTNPGVSIVWTVDTPDGQVTFILDRKTCILSMQ